MVGHTITLGPAPTVPEGPVQVYVQVGTPPLGKNLHPWLVAVKAVPFCPGAVKKKVPGVELCIPVTALPEFHDRHGTLVPMYMSIMFDDSCSTIWCVALFVHVGGMNIARLFHDTTNFLHGAVPYTFYTILPPPVGGFMSFHRKIELYVAFPELPGSGPEIDQGSNSPAKAVLKQMFPLDPIISWL